MKKLALVLSAFIVASVLSACTATTKAGETAPASTESTEGTESATATEAENTDVAKEEVSTTSAVEQPEQTEQTEQASVDWRSKVNELADSDLSPTAKAEATEKLAREYKPTTDELEEFKYHVLQEFINFQYLEDGSNAEYMLNNLFQAIVLEHHDVSVVRDFALAFYHNTKNVFTGAEAVDSDSVKAYEELLFKAINDGR
ncbi:hypothetical protein ASD24_20625 [Paenibacillus sp. Root52]|uniref:Lipoprotein n=1 Tax=Paenibacillus amylolyticus TaxID=1451 RepID=A0AAP5LQW6_PAEAM|nr:MULTISPECIES: hypothetical protein [Paenibacillus]KQY93576.1 hypothetical protein ASD24_20625 [Paenibacillus sp. Root52]MDR6725973.1 hypothetical protein [Paenibacillus amylolyticus]